MDMPHLIKVFVGDSKENLGDSTYYRSSLSGADVERCHAHACEAIGFKNWRDAMDVGSWFKLRDHEAAALLQVPALAEAVLSEDKPEVHYRGTPYEYRLTHSLEDVEWSVAYLEVAAHGARLLGLELRFEEVAADYIDAGGEAHGAHW